MPVHYAVLLRDFDLDQATPAGSTAASTGLRAVHGSMGGTNQIMPGEIKKAIGLVIHLHGHVGAPIQIRVHDASVAHGKCHTGLATVPHIKGNGVRTVDKLARVAQGNRL